MRGSVQYPSHDHAVKVGLCLVAMACILCGTAWILASAQRPSVATVSLEVRTGFLPDQTRRGNVYLISEESGTILQVGRYSVEDGNPRLNLRIPEDQLTAESRWAAQFWHSGYATYRPYAQFITDERLRNRFSEIVSRAFRDSVLLGTAENIGQEVFQELFAKAQPRFREIIDDPEFLSLMIDLTIEEGGGFLPTGDRLRIERTWVGPMVDLFFSKTRHWPWEEWVGEIVADQEKQEMFSEILSDLEPYFREALQELLWNRDQVLPTGPGYAPNVRLLWVARRTLFGAREPAITLMRSDEGQELNESAVFTVREVR